MYSVYKLNKQGDNIQPCCTPFPIWNQSVVPCPVLTVASWPAYRCLLFANLFNIVLNRRQLGSYTAAVNLLQCYFGQRIWRKSFLMQISRKGGSSSIIFLDIFWHFPLMLLLLSSFSRVWLCWPHRRQPTRLRRPWDSLGNNTGVGCHFLLQCLKLKSESEVTQSCPTLSDPMDCSPPGSSIHGVFQARVLEWGAIAFSVSFNTTPQFSKW